MRLETTGVTRTIRFGLIAIMAMVLSIGLTNPQIAWAQTADDGAGDASAEPSTAEQPDPAQQAHDDADAAQTALDAATQARDQLESDGAPQDQIDAANDAIARARADKEAADEAAEKADEASSQ